MTGTVSILLLLSNSETYVLTSYSV